MRFWSCLPRSSILLQDFVPDLLFVVGTTISVGASCLFALGLPSWCTGFEPLSKCLEMSRVSGSWASWDVPSQTWKVPHAIQFKSFQYFMLRKDSLLFICSAGFWGQSVKMLLHLFFPWNNCLHNKFDGSLGLRIWLCRLATRFTTVAHTAGTRIKQSKPYIETYFIRGPAEIRCAPIQTTWLLGEQLLLCLLKHLQQDSLSFPFLNVEMPECVALGVVGQIGYEW